MGEFIYMHELEHYKFIRILYTSNKFRQFKLQATSVIVTNLGLNRMYCISRLQHNCLGKVSSNRVCTFERQLIV